MRSPVDFSRRERRLPSSRTTFLLPIKGERRIFLESRIRHQLALNRKNFMAVQTSVDGRPTPAKEEQSPTPARQEQTVPTKDMLADKIITENALWAAGGGLIPIPMLDMVAIFAVEVKMLRELAALYEVP